MLMSAIRSRPFGVTAIVVLQLLSCILLLGALYLDDGETLRPLYGRLPRSGDLPLFVGYGATLLGALVAPGLWKLRRWAWVLTMIQLGLRMGTGLFAYLMGDAQYFQMFINVITVFYLNQRDVQLAFGYDQTISIPISDAEEKAYQRKAKDSYS